MKPRQPPRIERSEDRCQFQQAKSLGDVSGSPIPDLCSQRQRSFLLAKESEGVSSMAPTALTCKECGHAIRSRRTTSASSASGRSRSATTTAASTRRRRSARSRRARADIWRYADFLPLAERPRDPAAARPDAAGPRRPARRAPRPRRGLDQERRRQPDPLVQGPGRRGRAGEGARARLRDRRLRLDRQPRQRRRRPRRRRRAGVLRLRAGRPRGAEAARDRRLRHQAGRRQRQLRRRQPALHASSPRRGPGRSSTSTCGRTTPRARRRSPSRSSSSSAGSCPTGSSARSPPARCSRRSPAGFSEWLDLGLVEGELPVFNGAQAAGCSPVAEAFAEGWDVCKPQRPDTIAKSLAIGNPADGPYALELARAHRRRDRRRSPTTRSAPGSGCSPRPPGSSPRPPAA